MDVWAIREAIADELATLDGLRATPGVFDHINPPQVVIKLRELDPYAPEQLELDLWLLVSTTLNRSAGIKLASYTSLAGDRSIWRHLHDLADPTLGGLCDDLTPRSWDSEGAVRLGEGLPEYLGARLHVTVVAKEALL